MAKKQKTKRDLDVHYLQRVKREISGAPWVLRITEHKNKSVPVMIVKERILPDQRTDIDNLIVPRSILKECGLIYGQKQVRCLPVIRTIFARICDQAGISLELQQYLNGKRIIFRGNLPLDAEAGCKLALIFKLQERLKELDRIELIARRVDRFTREEASYWHSRITSFGTAANRWAMAGMKVMLSGHPRDPNIESMLDDLRQLY